jgi:DNA-binding NarL/FixJ family response regulator
VEFWQNSATIRSEWAGVGEESVGTVAENRILIADDHPLVRGALKEAVSGLVDGAGILEAGDFDAITETLGKGQDLDLILLDLTMPGVQGFSGLMYLRAQHPGIPVVVVSGNEDRGVIRRCIEFGASGFIPKSVDVDTMRNAIRTVLAGGTWTPADVDLSTPVDRDTNDLVKRLSSLTPQQVRVLMMLSDGLLNKQIAYELGVSEATVKAHVSAILQKLGVESRTQAVIAASKIAAGQWASAPTE